VTQLRSTNGPSITPTPDRNQQIGIFAAPEEFAALSDVVSQLPCAIVHKSGVDAAPAFPGELTAAVVSDSLDRPFDLCAALSKCCPTILVANDSSFEFRLAAVRAGADALLLKPVDARELSDWLEHLVGPTDVRPFSILIVDDDELVAAVYAQALRKAGMAVRIADSARAALDRFYTDPPDLVLMDVQMPVVNGIELARIIRQSRRYLSIPIVFLSAEQDVGLQMEARRFGGDDFIVKPIEPVRLVSLVRLRAERACTVRAVMERDSLTGLLNHARFKDRLAHELERCSRTGGELSVAMIDLDRFKQVNDTYGHLVGDRVIRGLSSALASGLRKIDILGRYGGEEFGVILLDTAPPAAEIAIDNLRAEFCEIEFDVSSRRFRSSFSAGVAGSRSYPSADRIIAAADSALYAAKETGRNKVVTIGRQSRSRSRGRWAATSQSL
jgi:diguanylate cyclase (GGDEF)-like protein